MMAKRKWSKVIQRRSNRPEGWINRIRIAVILFATIIGAGIIGYMVIERLNFLDALYMTIITISTVGYGEVKTLTDPGRIFTLILIIGSLTTFAYAATTLSVFIVEGGIKKVINDYRNMKKVESMENHVIIAGFGRYGHQVLETLTRNNLEVIVVEKNQEKVSLLSESGSTPYIIGDASQDEILEEANINKARAIIVTLAEDAENVFICLSARQLNPEIRIISRAEDSSIEKKILRAGANHVIKPEQSGGLQMANLVTNNNLLETLSLLNEMNLHFENVDCSIIDNAFLNKRIENLKFRNEVGIYIIGIQKPEGYIINPHPHTHFEKSDKLVIIGNEMQIQKFRNLVSGKSEDADSG